MLVYVLHAMLMATAPGSLCTQQPEMLSVTFNASRTEVSNTY